MNSRRKGADGERELAGKFSDAGFEARRGQQHAGGSGSPDIVHSIPWLHVECKRVEAFRLYASLDQSRRDSGEKMPIVCHRKKRSRWVVVLDMEDFFKLAREYEP